MKDIGLDLTEKVKGYFNSRGLMWPNFSDAMKFVATEIGEVYEIDLARKIWVRNNPDQKPEFNKENLAEELGDVIFMLIVAGITEGVDPIKAMNKKMDRKWQK